MAVWRRPLSDTILAVLLCAHQLPLFPPGFPRCRSKDAGVPRSDQQRSREPHDPACGRHAGFCIGDNLPVHGRRWGRRGSVIFAGVAVVAAAIWTTRRVPAPIPDPEGAFAFAALGDAPYYGWEQRRFRLLLRAGGSGSCGASSTLEPPVLNDLTSAIERRRFGA